MPLSTALRPYDHVLLDLDGCVWVGDRATPRAPEAIAALRAAGKGVAFVTNDARGSGEDFVRKLWGLGIQASLREVVTVGGALQHVLATDHTGKTAYVIGAPAIHRHVADAGLRIVNHTDLATRAQIVVVAGHDGFDYDELRAATRAVRNGAELLGANRDPTFPLPDGPSPASGPVLAAVEAATGISAPTVGKPGPQLFATALDRLGPGRAIHVGDRADADLAGAIAAGIDGALVGGETDDRAVASAPTLADLVLP